MSTAQVTKLLANLGQLGVKLWVAVHMSDPRLGKIVDHAQSLKAVIFQHSWYKTGSPHTPGESTPMDVLALLWPATGCSRNCRLQSHRGC